MRSARLARLLNPFDGPGPRRTKKLVDGALRSLGDGPPAGGPSSYSKVFFITSPPQGISLGIGKKTIGLFWSTYGLPTPSDFL